MMISPYILLYYQMNTSRYLYIYQIYFNFKNLEFYIKDGSITDYPNFL